MNRKLFGLALASMMVFTVACAEEEPEMEEMPAAEETMPAPAPAPMPMDTMGADTMGMDTMGDTAAAM
jgi:hypothetical protein